MKVGETLGPAAGGALVLVAWFAPMGLQILAIPLAVLSWRHVPTGRTTGNTMVGSLGVLVKEFRDPEFLALQSVGFFRFFFKFGFLTFMPLLAVQSGLLSLFEVGLVLTVSAASALVVAALMTRITIKRPSSFLIGANLVVVGVSLAVIGLAQSTWVLVAASIGFGMADSAASIIYTAVISEAIKGDMRATFVAANGAIRNLGKFAAPVAVGLLLLTVSMSVGFVLLGAAAAVVGLSAKLLRGFDIVNDPKLAT